MSQRGGFVWSTEIEPLPREEGSWIGILVLDDHLSVDFPEFPRDGFPYLQLLWDFFFSLEEFWQAVIHYFLGRLKHVIFCAQTRTPSSLFLASQGVIRPEQ